MGALRGVRKQLVDILKRAASTPHRTANATHAAGISLPVPITLLATIVTDDKESASGAAALSAENQPGTVLLDVAEKLYKHAALIAFTAGDDVGTGMRMASAGLCEDLARVKSNGCVDAAGKRSHT